jgi:hypothetical protein
MLHRPAKNCSFAGKYAAVVGQTLESVAITHMRGDL